MVTLITSVSFCRLGGGGGGNEVDRFSSNCPNERGSSVWVVGGKRWGENIIEISR